MERKLSNNPLIVEIFERDKTKDSDHCLGIVKIPLNRVLSNYSKKSSHKGNPWLLGEWAFNDNGFWIGHACLTCNDVGQIVANRHESSNTNGIGQLVYNLTLEDFGPLKEQLGTEKTEKVWQNQT